MIFVTNLIILTTKIKTKTIIIHYTRRHSYKSNLHFPKIPKMFKSKVNKRGETRIFTEEMEEIYFFIGKFLGC